MALRSVLFLMLAAALAVVGGCGGTSDAGRPSVVATHEILGALANNILGDRAEVIVLMPAGSDPHDYQPSARDIARLNDADFIVANGLGLEPALDEAIGQAKADGRAVLVAGDLVDVRRADGADDPHFWTDPVQAKAVARALGDQLESTLKIPLSAEREAQERSITALDAETEQVLARVPPARRKLVTGHESLGYFARRYGFTLVGAAVPGLSSQARVSASELSDLDATIRREGIDVVFAEQGTSRQAIDAVAAETGARVVELPAHGLPKGGSYDDLIRITARRIAAALG
jgi:zinc/manganese transport system substrate-binding protein